MRGSYDTPKILFELPHRYIVCVCVCVPKLQTFWRAVTQYFRGPYVWHKPNIGSSALRLEV